MPIEWNEILGQEEDESGWSLDLEGPLGSVQSLLSAWFRLEIVIKASVC